MHEQTWIKIAVLARMDMTHPCCTMRITHVPCFHLRKSEASSWWHQWMLEHSSTLSPTSPHHVRSCSGVSSHNLYPDPSADGMARQYLWNQPVMLCGLIVLTVKGRRLVFMRNFQTKPPDHPLLKVMTVGWGKMAVSLCRRFWTGNTEVAPVCHCWQVW